MTEEEIKDAAASYAWKVLNTATPITIEENFVAGAKYAMPKWISVTEGLPEIGMSCIVLLEGGNWLKGYRYEDGWYALYSNGQQLVLSPTITHWMPGSVLPSPPNMQPL